MPLHVIRTRVLPADFLDLQARSEFYTQLDDTAMTMVLAVLAGQGVSKPTLIQTDDTGRLLLGSAGALIGQVRLQDALTATLATIYGSPGGDADAGGGAVLARAYGAIYNGATWDRARSLSAANLGAQSGIGGEIQALPGMWAVTSDPGAGVLASASRVAGGVGVRHVATGLMISAAAAVAPAATVLRANLRDGASGAGTILASLVIFIAAAIAQSVPPLLITGLNIPGTANTAMTWEFSSLLASLQEVVSLFGYDVS